MNATNATAKSLVRAAVLLFVATLAGCQNYVPPAPKADPAPLGPDQAQIDAQRLNDGASKLTDAMKKPSESFHFSYQAEENLTIDPIDPPDVGKVALEADVTLEEIHLKETRGKVTEATKAESGNEVKWEMAHMTMVRLMSNPMLVIAVGASIANPPSEDLVGSIAADKFVFDTASELTPAQKVGLGRARTVISSIQSCKGTAWIAKDSGELVKFDIDAQYQDKNAHAWHEHYEGVVIPQ